MTYSPCNPLDFDLVTSQTPLNTRGFADFSCPYRQKWLTLRLN